MALDTYANLQTAIASWLHRSDLTSQIPDFIRLAEVNMNQDLAAKDMEVTTTLTTIPSNAYANLPSDFKQMMRLVLVSNPSPPLKFASPESIVNDYQYSDTGSPKIYTVIGNTIQFAPVPDSAYSVLLTYQQYIPALSNSNTTNWLLKRCPNAYLFGTLMMAAPFMINDQRIQTWQSMYEDAINGINIDDWHSGGLPRVRAG